MDKKTRPAHTLSTGDPHQNRRCTQNESKWLEKIFQENGQRKKAAVAILISDKKRHKRHFIILKVRIYQEAINIINPT